MPELLKTGSDWFLDQAKSYNSISVTYRRDADTVTVNAMIGRTLFENDDDISVVEKFRSRDFIIQQADLLLNSVAVEPERGDQIDEVRGSQTYTYEVMAEGGAPHFTDADDYHYAFRIHTKLVEVN